MPFVHRRRDWELPERLLTPESVFADRRHFLKEMGFAGLGLLAGCTADTRAASAPDIPAPDEVAARYPARRNLEFELERELTDEALAAGYNNFYEFADGLGSKQRVRQRVDEFKVRPWQVEVKGLVQHPRVYDADELVLRMPLEERLYRFRCVEAWAMAVPWTGFPFKALLDEVQPLSAARYVRLVSFFNPEQAPNQKEATQYPWPYYEGLAIEEAANELALLVTGIYGHELPKQHGAPLRLIAPWKYGYKSIKSIVSIEFTAERPPTFWHDLAPREYDFWSNVNPRVPHPRWSQATERILGSGERVPTLLYNGYGEYVAHLYDKT